MGKQSIPVELLRRSCRLQKSTEKIHRLVSCDLKLKRTVKDEPIGVKKRFKSEPKTSIKTEVKQTGSWENANLDSSLSCDKQVANTNFPPQPDGFLEIDEDELNLERTLLGGQSFRWTKEEIDGNKRLVIFTGIILNHVLQLWRISDDEIAFRRLNKESQNIKISATKAILEDYFQLKYNLKDLYQEWSSKDQHLSNCCQQYKGFRILRQDPVENVFSFICATNNNIRRISQMVDKLCRRYGNVLETNDDKQSIYNSYQSFPTIERLAEEDVFQCLRYELGFGYRAKFITETAKQLVNCFEKGNESPRDFLLSLRQLPYKDTCKQLMKFQGIGRKVADCICLMSMDHLNSVPIDCHIYEIFCRHYMPKLRQERKSLTESVHDMIGDYFNALHGSLAGWSTSVLFIAELRHLKLEKVEKSGEGKKKFKTKKFL